MNRIGTVIKSKALATSTKETVVAAADNTNGIVLLAASINDASMSNMSSGEIWAEKSGVRFQIEKLHSGNGTVGWIGELLLPAGWEVKMLTAAGSRTGFASYDPVL